MLKPMMMPAPIEPGNPPEPGPGIPPKPEPGVPTPGDPPQPKPGDPIASADRPKEYCDVRQ